jgi:hypothetical protein
VTSLGKLQVALIIKPVGDARNLAAGSRLAVPSLSCTYRKKGFIRSGKPRAGVFVSALLISLKAFLLLCPYYGFQFSPICGFFKGVLPRENNWGSRLGRNLQPLEIL